MEEDSQSLSSSQSEISDNIPFETPLDIKIPIKKFIKKEKKVEIQIESELSSSSDSLYIGKEVANIRNSSGSKAEPKEELENIVINESEPESESSTNSTNGSASPSISIDNNMKIDAEPELENIPQNINLHLEEEVNEIINVDIRRRKERVLRIAIVYTDSNLNSYGLRYENNNSGTQITLDDNTSIGVCCSGQLITAERPFSDRIGNWSEGIIFFHHLANRNSLKLLCDTYEDIVNRYPNIPLVFATLSKQIDPNTSTELEEIELLTEKWKLPLIQTDDHNFSKEPLQYIANQIMLNRNVPKPPGCIIL